MKKQAAVRPSKAEAIFGVVFGLALVALGLFLVTPMAGIFGLLWTLLAAIITFYNVYLGFVKKYPEPEVPAEETTEAAPAPDVDVVVEVDEARTRLAQLEEMHRSGIITAEELETRRQEVLQNQE